MTISEIVLAGVDAGNYKLTANTANTKASISQENITGVAAIAAGSKIYETTTKATVNNAGATFDGMFNGDDLTSAPLRHRLPTRTWAAARPLPPAA